MAQSVRLFIDGDTNATLFYELWYRIQNTTAWTQVTYNYPLPIYTSVSPATSSAYIGIQPLADNTVYEYQVRRFNNSNQYSDWETGTFTTGS
jgi:hypothetical protein